jgi:hypothetical protein
MMTENTTGLNQMGFSVPTIAPVAHAVATKPALFISTVTSSLQLF